MTIIYPVPEILPDPRARFIQIVNTCYALAEIGIKVLLIAGIKRGYSKKGIFRFYGLTAHPNLQIIPLPVLRREHARRFRFAWHGIFNFSLLSYLFLRKSYEETRSILFLRHIKLAEFILKFRRLLRTPIVFEVHEIFHLTTVNERKREKIKYRECMVYSKTDTIVSISQSIKKYLIQMEIPQKSIYVIQDAVKKEWLDIKRESTGSYIIYAGSLYLWKGIDTLISAMKYLPNEKLLMVGEGNRLDELKNLAITEGIANRVKFVGAVPHASIPEYLLQAKIAVLPNILHVTSSFSSPLKLFEYMACGIPIVASDIPVFREILTDRKNAILFEPGNPEAIAKAIKELADNPGLAQRLAITARKDAENYTYRKRAERIIEVIKAVSTKNEDYLHLP